MTVYFEYGGSDTRMKMVSDTIGAVGTTLLFIACKSCTNLHSSGQFGFEMGKIRVMDSNNLIQE